MAVMIVFALLGGVLGGALLSDFGGFVFGAALGALAGWVVELANRVRTLERKLEARRALEARVATETSAPPRTHEREAPLLAEPPRVEPTPGSAANARSDLRPPREPLDTEPPAAAPKPARVPLPRKAVPHSFEPSAIEKLFTKAWTWFTTGNVPVKVGVVLSLFGVGFLVKEGIDRQWLVLPLEFRLMGVALFGIGLLVLGWRLRDKNRTYALSVQGGGVGGVECAMRCAPCAVRWLDGGVGVAGWSRRGRHGSGGARAEAVGVARRLVGGIAECGPRGWIQ